MLEPSKKELLKVYKQEVARISKINLASFQTIEEIRAYIKKRLKRLLDNNGGIKLIEAYVASKYIKMFDNMSDSIIDAYNTSRLEHLSLAEDALGKKISLPFKPIKEFPKTKAFRITKRVLSDKSVTIRSKAMARRVSSIITNATAEGYGVEKTARLLDIELGYRNASGEINNITLKAMRSGRITHTNGHFYKSYRIARTESMRMSSIAGSDTFDELQAKGYNTRLKLLAHIDSRTREQSANMNGQVSDKEGKYLYPNGERYKLGSYSLPARYSINDRETQTTVFLD